MSDVSPATIYSVGSKRENERVPSFQTLGSFIGWKMWKRGIKGIKLLPAPLSWKWDEKSPIYSIISPDFPIPLFFTHPCVIFSSRFESFLFFIRKKRSCVLLPPFPCSWFPKKDFGSEKDGNYSQNGIPRQSFGFFSFLLEFQLNPLC